MIIEANLQNGWQEIAEVFLRGDETLGFEASCELLYSFGYVEHCLSNSLFNGENAVSCHNEVSFTPYETNHWPAFLLDLFPQGAALKYVVDHYRIADKKENYWQILNTAILSPPGNLRIQIPDSEVSQNHQGFEKEEVIMKGADFLEYMVECGAPISGSTGAGGAAPKFLLREDFQGKFFGERNLADHFTKQCWLVKFPRGEKINSVNKKILYAEKYWMDFAKQVGLKTHQDLEYYDGCLFIPRFDRINLNEKIGYLGMESFYSLVESREFGSRFRHKTYMDALYRFSNDKEEDLSEYILRDLLNLALGNTDNHGRNQSVIKKDQKILLSPLYDFAPMKFDPEGIVRNTRWSNDSAIFEEIENLWEKEYKCSLSHLKKKISDFWQAFCQIDFTQYKELSDFLDPLKPVQEDLGNQINIFLRK